MDEVLKFQRFHHVLFIHVCRLLMSKSENEMKTLNLTVNKITIFTGVFMSFLETFWIEV